MSFEPIVGKPVRIPPGTLVIRLDESHYRRYRDLYARYATILGGLPVLRDRDFDGRAVRISRSELEALNRAFSEAEAVASGAAADSAFDAQADGRTRLFKRLQYLS